MQNGNIIIYIDVGVPWLVVRPETECQAPESFYQRA